jgi:hypothetical protein
VLGEVVKFVTDYFLIKIKFLARRKRDFTAKSPLFPCASILLVHAIKIDIEKPK